MPFPRRDPQVLPPPAGSEGRAVAPGRGRHDDAAGTPKGAARTSRRAVVKRWAAAVLAFNIALGMGFSVMGLRHQADARSRADALLAELDAAASGQDALLWRGLTDGADDAALTDAAAAIDAAARAVAAGSENTPEDARVAAATVTYQHAAEAVRSA